MEKIKNAFLPIFSASFLAISSFVLIKTGYILDSQPSVHLSNWNTCLFWTTLVVSVILFVVSIIHTTLIVSGSKGLAKRYLITIAVCIFVLTCIDGICFYKFYHENRSISAEDYVESDWITGTTLDNIENVMNGAEDTLVYIGREDCKECKTFEAALTNVLKRYSTEIPAYYTNLDRDNGNDKYEQFLEEYNIESVPVVFWIKDGKIQERWDNPKKEIIEIEKCLQ